VKAKRKIVLHSKWLHYAMDISSAKNSSKEDPENSPLPPAPAKPKSSNSPKRYFSLKNLSYSSRIINFLEENIKKFFQIFKKWSNCLIN